MRSRISRPVMVELKTRRRSTTAAPASIWGDAASLLKAPPEPSLPSVARQTTFSTPVSQTNRVAPDAGRQPRRVLPDLRVEQAVTLEKAQPTGVARSSRKLGPRTILDSVKKQDEPQVEAAPPAPVEATRTAATGGAAPVVGLYQDEAQSEDALWESSAPSVETASEARPLVGNTATMLPLIATQRTRKWVRGVEDLPRGERWKRRLPEVCR